MNTAVNLTPRQSQMAELLAWGATKKDIANTLKVSIRTVENTIRVVFEKAEVTKVNELSAWWFCKHYAIPLNVNPLIRIAMILLLAAAIYLASGNAHKRNDYMTDTPIENTSWNRK